MNPIKIQIKEALENAEEWIKFYATEPEKKLQKRLRINHLQYAIAEKDKDEKALELLNIMERIIIEARIYKAEHNIPDELSEMEQALEQMELAQEKQEHRKEVLAQYNKQMVDEPTKTEPEPKTDNSVQLGLF